MPTPPEAPPRCPYPGLRPFRPDEADLFFGRDEQVDELLRRLGQSRLRFLAVVGESGCGKSSLILAGMIPALEAGLLDSDGADWRVASMRPGSAPMRNLAAILLDSGAIVRAPEHRGEDIALIEAELRRGPLGLLDVLREGGNLKGARLLLVVDQFEEIFRFRRDNPAEVGTTVGEQAVDRNEAAAFVSLLLRTVQEPEGRAYVVLTMRSDFLGDCALFAGLPEALNDSQFLTPRLSFDQRKAAIEGPALVEGGRIAPELTTALLNDMGPGPDQLPLMQHALMRAWNLARARGGPTRVEPRDYQDAGRLNSALSLHADSVYNDLSAEQKSIAERLFRALTGGNAGRRDTRRPTKLGDVAAIAGVSPEAVAEVVERFRGGDRNFLLAAGDLRDPETVLDISHESLIRQWTQLSRWAEAEELSAETYRVLEKNADWGEEPWTGANLLRVLEWRRRERPNAAWAVRYGGDFKRAMAFIQAGIESRKDQELARPHPDLGPPPVTVTSRVPSVGGVFGRDFADASRVGKPFRILSIDGGGIMGAFPAAILARYEERLNTRHRQAGQPPMQLVDHFDLITGTSTSGIIALGLGAGASAAEVLDIYRTQGPNIFPQPRGWLGRFWANVWKIFNASLSPEPLRKAVAGIAGDRTMASAWPRLVIPAYRATGDGHVYVFKTPHEDRAHNRHTDVSIVDVAMATGALPTIFPAHKIPKYGSFIDGGVWAECPISVGVAEAVAFCGVRLEDIHVLSLSTTDYPLRLGDELLKGGLLPWTAKFAEMLMLTQVQKEVALARCLLGDRFHRIDYQGVPGSYRINDSGSINELIQLGGSVADQHEHADVVFRNFLNGVRIDPIPGLPKP